MADGMKQKKSSVNRTDWTLYTLAAAMGIAVTLAAIFSHMF